VPLFATLSPSQKSQLCTALRPLHVKAGTTIVRKGDAGNTLYVVEAGTCTVYSPQGQVCLFSASTDCLCMLSAMPCA
jgi:signal-transduction protein with cAMP-binding, CBS, and nucleotidyltransferase domain